MLERDFITKAAHEVGFSLCGTARCRTLDRCRGIFSRWLDEGHSADLTYLRRNFDKRFNPADLVSGAKTIIVCAVNYHNTVSDGYTEDFDGAKIASYATMTDYHTTIKQMLLQLLAKLQERYPSLTARAFTDTAPVLEKAWAVEAGLGRIGRQSLLITPEYGSFVLLGELVVDAPCDIYGTPLEGSPCNACRRCVDACPNGAINDNHTIDTRKCISCLTLEGNCASADDTHGWLCGCDICQSVCPHNSRKPYAVDPRFAPKINPFSQQGQSLLANECLPECLSGTPLERAWNKKRRILKKSCK